jgi:hypothetical protein
MNVLYQLPPTSADYSLLTLRMRDCRPPIAKSREAGNIRINPLPDRFMTVNALSNLHTGALCNDRSAWPEPTKISRMLRLPR